MLYRLFNSINVMLLKRMKNMKTYEAFKRDVVKLPSHIYIWNLPYKQETPLHLYSDVFKL